MCNGTILEKLSCYNSIDDEKYPKLADDIKNAREELERLQLYESEHERLKKELNIILHPDGDGPESPAFCDLISYARSDLESLRGELMKDYDLRMKELGVQFDLIDITLEHPLFKFLSKFLVDLLDSYKESKNYLSVGLNKTDTGEHYEIVIHRPDGLSPAQLNAQLKEKIELVEDWVADLALKDNGRVFMKAESGTGKAPVLHSDLRKLMGIIAPEEEKTHE